MNARTPDFTWVAQIPFFTQLAGGLIAVAIIAGVVSILIGALTMSTSRAKGLAAIGLGILVVAAMATFAAMTSWGVGLTLDWDTSAPAFVEQTAALETLAGAL